MTEAAGPITFTDEKSRTHQVEAVVFDKDGTLLDFHASWDAAVGRVLDRLTEHDLAARTAAAQKLGYDLTERRVLADSPIIAESNEFIVELVRPIVGHLVSGDLTDHFNQLIAEIGTTMVAAAAGAEDLLRRLHRHGIAIGLATNDAETVARAQLEHLGWDQWFSAVVGYDSGFGAKPEPAMVTGCAALLGVPAHRCVMVGDSVHDLVAATAAGAVAVLVGHNPAATHHADAMFQRLSELGDALLPSS